MPLSAQLEAERLAWGVLHRGSLYLGLDLPLFDRYGIKTWQKNWRSTRFTMQKRTSAMQERGGVTTYIYIYYMYIYIYIYMLPPKIYLEASCDSTPNTSLVSHSR